MTPCPSLRPRYARWEFHDVPVRHDLRGNVLHEVAGDGKPNAGRTAAELGVRRGECRDPDRATFAVDERAAGVTRVDRRTRLDYRRQRDGAPSSGSAWRNALTIPSVTLERRPSGFPIATAMSPTWSFDESVNTAGLTFEPLTLTTARSSDERAPRSAALFRLPFGVVTTNEFAAAHDVVVGDAVALSNRGRSPNRGPP